MENKNNTPQEPTRRQFAKRAYVAPVVLAAIKATESTANAQAFPEPPPPTIASVP